MIERTVYQCEHCKKYGAKPRIFCTKRGASKHEKDCFYNDKKRSCFTCKHNTREYISNGRSKPYELGCNLGLIDCADTEQYSLYEVVRCCCDKWESKLNSEKRNEK